MRRQTRKDVKAKAKHFPAKVNTQHLQKASTHHSAAAAEMTTIINMKECNEHGKIEIQLEELKNSIIKKCNSLYLPEPFCKLFLPKSKTFTSTE